MEPSASPVTLELRPTRLRYRPELLSIGAGALLLTVMALLLVEGWHPLFRVYFGAGVLLLVGDFVWGVWPRGSRASLLVGRHSVRVSASQGWRELAYSTLESIALDEAPYHRNGVEVAFRRRLTLKDGRSEVRLEHFAPSRNEDPFQVGVSALVTEVGMAFEQRLAAGQQLRGYEWTLEATVLSCEEGRLPRSDLSRVAITEAGVQVWYREQPAPVLTVPLGSRNARVLAELLARSLPRNDTLTEGPGHLLFRRRSSIVNFVGVVLAGLAMMGFAWGSHVWMAVPWWSEVAIAGWSVFLLGAAWRIRPAFLSVHTRGMTFWRWPSRPFFLHDAEVMGLGFSVTPLHVLGISVGHQFRLTAVPDDARRPRVEFKNERWRPDPDMEGLFRRLLPGATARLAAQLESGRWVQWGDALLSSEGLHVKLEETTLGKPMECFPLSRLRFQQSGRSLRVADAGGRVLVTLPEHALNFHSGLQLLRTLGPVEVEAEDAG